MIEKNIAPLRPAASMLFIRDSTVGLEVYMVVRSRLVDFAANAMVFPGGKVTPADAALAETLRSGQHLAPLHRSHAVAALRESFEEAGLLLAHDHDDIPVGEAVVRRLDPLRAAIDTGQHSFAAILEAEQLCLQLDHLYRFAHIITPKVAPKRFDTHFYIAPCPSGHGPLVDMSEVVAGFWLRPAAALQDSAREFLLMRPTRMVLERLACAVDVDSALADAAAFDPSAIEPEFQLRDGVQGLATPDAPGFPASWEVMDKVWAASVGRTLA
jgi:8-oxo-dGTP pyrophosphatase MutT (NUDIX family)